MGGEGGLGLQGWIIYRCIYVDVSLGALIRACVRDPFGSATWHVPSAGGERSKAASRGPGKGGVPWPRATSEFAQGSTRNLLRQHMDRLEVMLTGPGCPWHRWVASCCLLRAFPPSRLGSVLPAMPCRRPRRVSIQHWDGNHEVWESFASLLRDGCRSDYSSAGCR